EYLFILGINKRWNIVRVLEFLNTKATEDLRGGMMEARENLKGERGSEVSVMDVTCFQALPR
ncbi:hypothetical protein BDU57DRAFT_569189, partial [Ampelomyces quisqualis]